MPRKSGNPAKRGWDPLQIFPMTQGVTPMSRAFLESNGRRHHYVYRTKQRAVACKGFRSRFYDGAVLEFEDGSMHLSFKRLDRAAIRDWRHFQAIKNEVAGAEREAIEIFPPESLLVDAANEYHLWVLPKDRMSPLGLAGGRALGPPVDLMDHAAYRQGKLGGTRQRGWEEGIPTGFGRQETTCPEK